MRACKYRLNISFSEISLLIVNFDYFRSEDIASILNSGLGLNHDVDVETLLGPGFRPQLPQEPLQQVDLSFGDPFQQQFHFMQHQNQPYPNQ